MADGAFEANCQAAPPLLVRWGACKNNSVSQSSVALPLMLIRFRSGALPLIRLPAPSPRKRGEGEVVKSASTFNVAGAQGADTAAFSP